jgi:hypothetical protein
MSRSFDRRAAGAALGACLALAVAFPNAVSAMEKVPVARVAGTPTITPGAGPLYHLWRDEAGFHLRWVGRGAQAAVRDKKAVFTGLIQVVGGKVSMIKPAGMVGGDDSVNRLDAQRVMFKSECVDAIEGVDFKAGDGATSLYMELFVDYEVIAPQTVRLGAAATPASDISPMLQIDLTAPVGP